MKFTLGNKKIEREDPRKSTSTDKNLKKEFCHIYEKRELINKRTEDSKTFVNEDGSMSAQIYDEAIHYKDTSDETFKDIDNRLFDAGEILETRAGRFKTRFNKQVRNGRIYDMESGGCRIGLISLDAAKNGEAVLESCNDAEQTNNNAASKVKLRNINSNTDFEYTVDASQVKEDIIIKERSDKYEYDFELAIDNLYVSESQDGKTLELKSKTLNDVKFYIPAPFMTDAAGGYSDNVYYEIVEQTSDLLSLKVVADSDWMNAADRVFPVTIDPVIRVAKTDPGTYYGAYGYEQGMFRYESYDENNNLIGQELKIYSLYTESKKKISSKLIILKNKISSYILQNLIEAKLVVSVAYGPSRTVSFDIDSQEFTPSSGYKLTIDITKHLLNELESKAEIKFEPHITPRVGVVYADVKFTSPTLELKYSNKVARIEITVPPSKTNYESGEKFDSDGMVVVATYDNGEKIPVTGYKIYPSGTLASYDDRITVTFEDKSVNFDGITVTSPGFDDRRPAEGLENVYRIVPFDINNKAVIDGKPHTGIMYARLELCDGAQAGKEGTPLNAAKLNNIKVKASNIIQNQ